MASSIDHVHAASDLGATLVVASNGAAASGELMLASGTVIALRAAIGARGPADPAKADHGELARLLPEKAEAISAASMILCSSRPARRRIGLRSSRSRTSRPP